MTEGEKMVWAATYARYYMDDYDKEMTYGKKRYTRSVPSAIEWAWSAVHDMRKARKAVEEGWGKGEVLEMLDEMTGHENTEQ